MKKIFTGFKETIVLILPNSRKEYFLLFFFLFLYYPLGIYLSLTTEIIDKKETYDMYFSFDNGYALYVGSNETATHPLTAFFYLPLKYIHDFIVYIHVNEKVFTLLILFLCSFFISYSNLLVFKYFKNIIKLNQKIVYLLTGFFSVFSCPIILSFTPETFTLTLFLLIANIYIVSYFIANNQKISTVYYIISGTLIGGQSITNSPKALIPLLFEEKFTLKNGIHLLKKGSIITFFVTFFILIPWKFNVFSLIGANLFRKKVFQDADFPLFNSFFSYFFGGNILLPSLRGASSPWEWVTNLGIYPNIYDSWYQYLFVFIILLLLMLSIIKGTDNKLLWILVLSFGVDLFYLLILKIGTNESIIYGGHFIFIVPLLIGWLFKNISDRYQMYLGYLITIFIFILIINNGFRVWQFIQLAQNLYP